MRVALGLVVLCSFASAACPAEPRWLGDNDLTFVFVGREVAGAYANGVTFTETYRKIGKAEYRDTQSSLEGSWSIKGAAMCTHYRDKSGGCFRVSRQSANCFELWLMSENGELAGESWIARSWQVKYPSTCPR
jgi:hypothetical protein